MIVSRRDVGRQGTEGIKGGFVTFLELFLHVHLNQVHRHMARTLDHGLDVVFPRDFGQLAQRFQFGELRLVIRVGD